jgi:hypothetical protein
MPNIDPASRKMRKLPFFNAQIAVKAASAAEQDDKANPYRRPILRISIAAGTVVIAVASTTIDTGNVAHA